MSSRTIASRFRNMTVILLAIILAIVILSAVVMVSTIRQDASYTYARFYSLEAMEKLSSFLNREIVLVQETVRSKALKEWFANEDDPAKKERAFEQIAEYISFQNHTDIYFVVESSKNEYILMDGAKISDCVPYDMINPELESDRWYYDCIESLNEYSLNIDTGKTSNSRRLWVNCKVMDESKLLGVLCASLQYDDVFDYLFEYYDLSKVWGLVVSADGYVQMDSAHYGIGKPSGDDEKPHISEIMTDTVSISLVESYLKQVKHSQFNDYAEPKIERIKTSQYDFITISPIRSSDWIIVTFFDSSFLFSFTNFLPLLIVVLLMFIAYTAVCTLYMRNLAILPLRKLTDSVSKTNEDGTLAYTGNRDDEFGVLAHNIEKMIKRIHVTTQERDRQAGLLYDLNNIASVLLASADDDDFENLLLHGMEMMARCVDVDRVIIWQSEAIKNGFHSVARYKWVSEAGREGDTVELGESLSRQEGYRIWEEMFSHGECVNGPAADFSKPEQEILDLYNMKTVLMIPTYLQERFWGFISFDDCHAERYFYEEDINILRSGGLMLINAINRSEQASKIRKEHERTKLMLDANPLCCTVWDKNYHVLDCNDAAVKLFKFRNKQEYVERFFELSPHFQPSGELSVELIARYVKKAFEDGYDAFDWLHQMPDGTLIETEVTLVRVRYVDDFVVVAYTRDMREILRLQRVLKDALAEAQAASQTKSNFLSNMSHEIRTPMNAIIGMSDILANEPLTEHQMSYVNDISASASALLGIINDILDLSKIESGKLSLSPVNYDFHALLDNVNSMFTYVAQKKGIEFKLEPSDGLPEYLFGDDIRLRQVLTNICGNAIKFTEKGSVRMKVSTVANRGKRKSDAAETGAAEKAESMVVFEIIDTGVGIQQEDLPKIFNAYEQVDKHKNRGVVGTGLGLAICKAFVEAMGGKIMVESEYEHGTVFTVMIPAVPGNKESVRVREHLKKEQTIIAHDVNVLVVDDNEFNLKVAYGLLKLFKIEAKVASSGREAINMVQQTDYDVIFMDHMMPEMDGVETSIEIRKLGGKFASVPIVALTANAISGVKEMFMANGFCGFISKPIDLMELDGILNQVLPPEKIERKQESATEDAQNDAQNDAGNDAENVQTGESETNSCFLDVMGSIDEINTEVGMSHFSGLTSMYEDTTEVFYKNLQRECDKMSSCLDNGNINGFMITVHAMKSALSTIGALKLSDLAAKLESAAKENDADFCATRYPELLEKLSDLRMHLSSAFPANDSSQSGKAPGDEAHLRKQIQELIKAADDFDSDTCDDIFADLSAYDFGPQTNALLEEAASAATEFRFGDAVQSLLLVTSSFNIQLE